MEGKLEKFEQTYYEELVERFIDKNRDSWDEFVFEQFQEFEADYSDYLYDQEKDRQLELSEERRQERLNTD